MPSSIVRSTTEVDVYRQTFRPAGTEYLITGRGEFSANVTKIDLHQLWTQRLQENLPRVWRIEVPPVRSGIWFSAAPSDAVYADGIEVPETNIGLLPASAIIWQRSRGRARMVSMTLPTDDMAEISIALTGRDLIPASGTLSAQTPPAALERVRRLHSIAGRLAETVPELICNPDAARGLEQALIDAMFACLAQGNMQEDVASRRRHSAIVRRLHALAASRPHEPLYLTDVCSAIGVNQRTLTLCCQEQLGISPKRFLMLRRMHLARQTLLAGTVETTTVTDIATRYGFWELGRFAVAYKATFGESPSATLRRGTAENDVLKPGAFAVFA